MRGSIRMTVAGAALLALPVQGVAMAQLGQTPPSAPLAADCACTVAPPGDGDETEAGRARKKNWAILGAAGLGLVFGLPFGGGAGQGLPFAGAVPTELPAGDVAALPVDGALPAPLALGSAPAANPALAGPAGGYGPSLAAGPAPAARGVFRRGLIPPRTATHLPLIAALGVAMSGGGLWLLRRRGKQTRRRRRKVLL